MFGKAVGRFGVSNVIGGFRRQSVRPTQTVGVGGTAVYSGFVVENEKDPRVAGREKFTTYSNLLANTSIVAAGTRYFLNLLADADWKVEPADPDNERAVELAEIVNSNMQNMVTTWPRIVRRAAMYRFWGFSFQEWTAVRKTAEMAVDAPEGTFIIGDIEPRAQKTIERWDLDERCNVKGVVQRSPQDSTPIYIPRWKCVYMVDDTLNDSPEGLGLFRHLVEPVNRLNQMQQLELIGYETDLRGVPLARVPYGLLQGLVTEGRLSQAQADAITKPIEDFVQNHVRNIKSGLVLDSQPYTGQDEAATPSRVNQFDMELLRGEGAGVALKEIAAAIDRVQREIARILGVEQFLLGGGERGSFALSKDKTQAFLLLVNATLNEIVKGFEKDFVRPLFDLNGWPLELMPTLKAENVQFRDIAEMSAALRDLGMAGVILSPEDDAVGELFDMMGLSRPAMRMLQEAAEAEIRMPGQDNRGGPRQPTPQPPAAQGGGGE